MLERTQLMKGVVSLQVPKGSLPSPVSSMSPLGVQWKEEIMAEETVAVITFVGVHFCPFLSMTRRFHGLAGGCYGFYFFSFLLLTSGIKHFTISTTTCLMFCFVLMEVVVE